VLPDVSAVASKFVNSVDARTLKVPPYSAMFILYSVTAAPPLRAPSSQVRPKVVASLCTIFSARLTGASGVPIMNAPSPTYDSLESPLILVAITLT
jgi:hypothetical protein